MQEYHGNLREPRWNLPRNGARTASLRHLEALLVVADAEATFLLSGNGDVIEPDDGISPSVRAGPTRWRPPARCKHTKMGAKEIAQEAMRIASEICIFTNANLASKSYER